MPMHDFSRAQRRQSVFKTGDVVGPGLKPWGVLGPKNATDGSWKLISYRIEASSPESYFIIYKSV